MQNSPSCCLLALPADTWDEAPSPVGSAPLAPRLLGQGEAGPGALAAGGGGPALCGVQASYCAEGPSRSARSWAEAAPPHSHRTQGSCPGWGLRASVSCLLPRPCLGWGMDKRTALPLPWLQPEPLPLSPALILPSPGR